MARRAGLGSRTRAGGLGWGLAVVAVRFGFLIMEPGYRDEEGESY